MQIAFKFPAEEMETTLLDVAWSRSGQNYTPVGIVETVKLMGTNVSRASLANPDMLRSMGIKLGAKVVVSKRGDIIPKIERVIETPPDASEVVVPTVCETCKTLLVNEGTRLYCPNENCPKKAYFRILRWIWVLGIKHFSQKLMLRPLFNAGKIKSIADLYKLQVRDLVKLEGVKEKSAQKAIDNLHAVKRVSLPKFVAGFYVENIGADLTQRVVDAGFDTLDKIKNATISELTMIDGFAEITAQTLKEGIEKLYPQMKELLDSGVIKIKGESQETRKLEGLSFCFTGKLDSMSRKEAEELVREHGGKAKSSVNRGLSYLVTNSTEKTAKFVKAQEQGTKIITEKEFLELL